MKTSTPRDSRPMRKLRFLTGLVLSACGVATMLMVAAGTLQNLGVNGRLSLPAVGLCMIVGLMLLGGGFGIMATSAATFDDREFDRLMEAGNLPLPTPLDSSCDIESPDSEEGNGRSTEDLRSNAEPRGNLVNVPREVSTQSGDVRSKRSVSAPQTSV
ncbi:MAG TPA: hypothetical protein EYG03_13210 [Planctomycetes bacterium]|nr:hypothetical protein [Fuerstiella sp.]HIK92921.1 hypothetical protein [Planctomycetota bacterium]